jgi:CO/xanthine dehydrogenase Mo-binding subunit
LRPQLVAWSRAEDDTGAVDADEIGIAPNGIRVVAGDTDRSPSGSGTFASRSLVIAGGACKLAAATLRDRLQAVAGQLLEADPSDIELSAGRAFARGTDLGVEVQQLARAAYDQRHRFPVIAETGLSAVATYDPMAPSQTPAMWLSSKSILRPAKSWSSGSWSSKTPAL